MSISAEIVIVCIQCECMGAHPFRVSCQTRRSVCESVSAGERVVVHMNLQSRFSVLSFFMSSTCSRTLRASPTLRNVAGRANTLGGITSCDNTIVKTALPRKELSKLCLYRQLSRVSKSRAQLYFELIHRFEISRIHWNFIVIFCTPVRLNVIFTCMVSRGDKGNSDSRHGHERIYVYERSCMRHYVGSSLRRPCLVQFVIAARDRCCSCEKRERFVPTSIHARNVVCVSMLHTEEARFKVLRLSWQFWIRNTVLRISRHFAADAKLR